MFVSTAHSSPVNKSNSEGILDLIISSPTEGTFIQRGEPIVGWVESKSKRAYPDGIWLIGSPFPLGDSGKFKGPPYKFTVRTSSTLPPQTYQLTAVGLDSDGQMNMSDPVHIRIGFPDANFDSESRHQAQQQYIQAAYHEARLGNFQAAPAQMSKALALDPNDPLVNVISNKFSTVVKAVPVATGTSESERLTREGVLFYLNNDLSAAISSLQQAQNANPNNSGIMQLLRIISEEHKRNGHQ